MRPDPLHSTLSVYRRRAAEWEASRSPDTDATSFGAGLGAGDRPVLDAGCGPGWSLDALGSPVIALDAVEPFVRRAAEREPGSWPVLADLRALPFRRRSLGAAWASRSLVHLPRAAVPLALWDLHRSLRPDAPVAMTVFSGDAEHDGYPGDDFPGRRFSGWPPDLLRAVVEGAGFDVESFEVDGDHDGAGIRLRLRRLLTLADTVGPDMSLLIVGLNPSPYAAEVGVGFARPGNRFWPAALRAGIVSRDRDPHHALVHHAVGMSDLAKRPTAKAAQVSADEFRQGFERVGRMVAWLRPRAVCVVGITGWRAATGRRDAVLGAQDATVLGVPTYVMPNPSGLNAHTDVDDLARHLRAAAALGEP